MDFPELPAPDRRPEAQPLALYGAIERWADRVNALDLIREHSDDALPGRGVPGAASARWTVVGVAAVLLCVVIFSADWKIRTVFHPNPAERALPTTMEVAPLAEREFPDGLRAPFSEINALLAAQNWQQAAERADKVRTEPGTAPLLRLKPAAYLWLHETLAALETKRAANQRAEKTAHRHVKEIVEAYDRSVRAPSFSLLYSYALALFELDGGTQDGAIQMKGRAREAALLRTIAELRNTFGPKIAADRELARKLLRIEGYTLARALEPGDGGFFSAPFDAKDAHNVECWNRLDELLAQWQPLEGAAPNIDFLNLRQWFWQQIKAFCRWRHLRDEIQIGKRTYKKSTAEAHLNERAEP